MEPGRHLRRAIRAPSFPAVPITGKTRSTRLAKLRDKEPHLAPINAVFKFGANPLKSALQVREFVYFTVPKKVSHSRASELRFHLLDHAATAEEAR